MTRSKSHKAKSSIDRKNFIKNINKIENSETTIDNDDEKLNVNDGTTEINEIGAIKVKDKSRRRKKKFNFDVILSFIKKHYFWELMGLLISVVIWGVILQYKVSSINDEINKIENIVKDINKIENVIDKIKGTDTSIKDYKNDILIEIKDIRKELGDISKNLTEIKTFLYIKKK